MESERQYNRRLLQETNKRRKAHEQKKKAKREEEVRKAREEKELMEQMGKVLAETIQECFSGKN